MTKASDWLVAQVATISKSRKNGKAYICQGADISYKTLRAYCSGDNNPELTASQWQGFAQRLDVTTDKLLDIFSGLA